MLTRSYRGLFTRSWFALCGSLALLVGVVSPVPANADPVYIDGRPDTGDHIWCYYDVSTLRSYMDAAMTRLREQTVVNTAYHNPCLEHTDVRWVQGPTPFEGLSGYTECKVWWDANQTSCDRWRITMHKDTMDETPDPVATFRTAHCHELGHSLGVQHYVYLSQTGDASHSCMRNNFTPNGASYEILYGAHHKSSHINPWFS